MQNKGFYKFGGYIIDVSQRVLLRDGKFVHLTPKAFNILLLLIQNHGRIVDKDTLMREVWPDAFVEEGNLAFNINTLRNILGKDESESHCIETVRKRGYRFVADVRYVDETYPQEMPPAANDQGQEEPNLQEGIYIRPTETVSLNKRPDLVWQYRVWLLRAGIFIVIAAAFDIILINRGVVLLKDLVLVALATVSLYIHIRVSRRLTRPDSTVVQASAFRGLLPFEQSGKDRFYGRNIDAAAVVDLITHSQFSKDGKHIASASEDQSVIIWNAEHQSKEAVLTGHHTRVSAVAIFSDSSRAASSDLHGEIILWDLAQRKPIWRAAPAERLQREFNYCLAISPDDRWIASSFGVYESATGRMLVDLRTRTVPTDTYGADVFGVSFSPDGRWLACVTVRSVIAIWEVETWQLRETYKLDGSSFISVCFSPDSKSLVTGEDQGAVRLWRMEPLQNIAILGCHSDTVKSVVFSPDGREVASTSDDQTIALWDVKRRSFIRYIGTHTAPVLSVAFSPDEKRLVSGEHDKSVRIYTRIHTLWGHKVDQWVN